MPDDLFPTRAQFRAGLQRAARRRRAYQRLAAQVSAPPPSGVTDPALLAELTELGAKLMGARPRGRPQTGVAKEKSKFKY